MDNRKKAMEKKYRRRRVFIVILAFIIVLSAGIFIGGYVLNKIDTAGAEIEVEQETQPPEPIEVEIEPEPTPEPEPDPEPKAEDWALILVNYEQALEKDLEIELEQVSGSYSVDARIATPFKRMMADAKAEGLNLDLFSAYRDPVKQEEIFQKKMDEHMSNGLDSEQAYEATAKWIAPPWHSEHHTGLAVDIATPETGITESFERTPAFEWLQEHARDYGFILRYPKDKVEVTKIQYEPWHYRYVGVEVAEFIWEHDLVLEEYLEMKAQGDFSSVLKTKKNKDENSETVENPEEITPNLNENA